MKHRAGDVLSPAELAFRELLSRPADYAAWAHDVRSAWERTNKPKPERKGRPNEPND